MNILLLFFFVPFGPSFSLFPKQQLLSFQWKFEAYTKKEQAHMHKKSRQFSHIIFGEWGLTVHHLAMGMLSILQDNSKYITNKSALTKQENVCVRKGKSKTSPQGPPGSDRLSVEIKQNDRK